jgi:hypothetical protein
MNQCQGQDEQSCIRIIFKLLGVLAEMIASVSLGGVAAYYGSRHSLADQGNLGVSGEPCALVVPVRAGLVASSPVQPLISVAGRAGCEEQAGEQVLDLGDGQRDHPGLGRGRLAGCYRCWRPGIGAVFQEGSGHGADRQGGHHQDDVAGDRGVEPDLALVQAEAVLAELEIFLANRRTSLIAANVSQHALFSSRWVRSGVRSPPCSATVHPFRFGSPLTSAPTYLPACSHGSARTKHDLSASAARSVSARRAGRLSWQQQPPSILLSSQTA